MPADSWKYEANTFLTVTDGSTSLMGEILRDHLPKLADAENQHSHFHPALVATQALAAEWSAAELALTNAEAGLPSATAAVTEKLQSLTRKPDLDTNSPIESWDNTIRSVVAHQGTTYTYLLPHGRDTLTGGTREENILALAGLAARLGEQAGKPALVTLGTTVRAFHDSLKALAEVQDTRRRALDEARSVIDALRVRVAWQLFANVGWAMALWNRPEETEKIGDLFDLSLIRNPAPPLPLAPALPTWDAAKRTLSVAAMPENATRLELWRRHSGGAGELLAVGETDALSVAVPSAISFETGTSYEIWFQGRNSRGSGPESPVVVWKGV